MPTRCNRGFYCGSYYLLNTFRAPLCPSSGAQEYNSVVAAWGISCCGFQFAVKQHPTNRTHNFQLHTRTANWNLSTKYHRQQTPYNTLELLMMVIVVPETCWDSNKICNKNPLLNLVGILFPCFKESIIVHFTCQTFSYQNRPIVITWYNNLLLWRLLFRRDTSAWRLIHRSKLYSSPVSLLRHFSINDKNFPPSSSRTMTSAVDWLQARRTGFDTWQKKKFFDTLNGPYRLRID